MARVLITGSASGFGRATAERLRAEGSEVAGLDLLPAPGTFVADVRDQEQVDAAVEAAVSALGGLDVLVNNAGIGAPQDAGKRPDELTRAVWETNFVGAWRVTAAALPALLETGGRVVNVASGLAAVNMPFAAAYIASKRALAGYSDVLRLEYGDRITVTTVYPGYVRTPIHVASEELGVSLDGVVPEESLHAVVRVIVRACTSRPRRDLATSPATAGALFAARHAPRLVDRVVGARVRALARSGAFDGAEIAAGFLRRSRSSRS